MESALFEACFRHTFCLLCMALHGLALFECLCFSAPTTILLSIIPFFPALYEQNPEKAKEKKEKIITKKPQVGIMLGGGYIS